VNFTVSVASYVSYIIIYIFFILNVADKTFVEKKGSLGILYKLWKDDYLDMEVKEDMLMFRS